MGLATVDTALRLIAIGQLALIMLVVARSESRGRIRVVTALLLAGVIGYLVNSGEFLRSGPVLLWAPVALMANLAALFLWLFAHLLFERPIDRRLAGGAFALLVGIWLIFIFARDELGWFAAIGQHLVSLLLAVHSVAIALLERRDDLVEARRRFRVGFVLVVGVQMLAVVLIETWYGFGRAPDWLMLFQSAIIVAAVLGTGAALLDADAELLAAPASRPQNQPQLSPAEHVLKQKLDAAMAQAVYRESGLTIGVLAERLGTPEHRLRALINRRLGYRNFSAFLNAHRIAEARALLADPGKVDLPVLTIAMDLGYGSLAPFNRAFREATAQTPSDYRRAAIIGPEQS